MKQFLISTTLVLALPAMASANMKHQDVVLDSNKQIVHDSFGGCVRTKWHVASEKCGKCDEHHLAYVFFDFDKWELRHEAYDTVRNLYNEVKQERKNVVFKVIGHTDTVGTAQYNKALSMRRAQTVKNELVKMGIPASHIKIQGRGFNELMVETPKGVAEPKNRRAEICYSIY